MGGPSPPFGIRNVYTKIPTEMIPSELYNNCLQESQLHESIYYLFCPDQFLYFWDQFSHQYDRIRAMRIMVQIGTIHACRRYKYFLPNGEGVTIDKRQIEASVLSTVMYESSHVFKPLKPFDTTTSICIVEGDCLETALWLKKTYPDSNPACLNMASCSNPGGGYRNGCGAQEENLHRRTNLFQCLDDPYQMNPSKSWVYPIPEFGGIYVRDSVVLRKEESSGYAFLEKPETMSFVCVSAYSNPPLEENDKGELVICHKMAQETKKKMSVIFEIAKDQGHDAIVLSAFGCGAYCNPPKHVAQLFKELLKKKYANLFKHVVFSIFDDHNTGKDHNPRGNLSSFAEVFGVKPIRLDSPYSQ